MVDVSKIKAGDEVMVRLVVINDKLVYNGVQCRSPARGWLLTVGQDDIVDHTPKPREIKVGDSVIRLVGSRIVWQVTAISGQRAWLTNDSSDTIVPVNTLTHAP